MRRLQFGFTALVALGAVGIGDASAQGVLRIAMTASDIPLTTGQTDQGGEGQRFMGDTAYDSLILWDLSRSDKASELVPGLAQSWAVDANDKTKWMFKIREGVRFHDGSEFTAEAAAWNFDKLLKNDSPQFDQRQAAQVPDGRPRRQRACDEPAGEGLVQAQNWFQDFSPITMAPR